MENNTKYFTSEIRITFTGKTSVDEAGNKMQVNILSQATASFIAAVKNTMPEVKIATQQNTEYSDEPIEVKVTTKKL